MWTYHEPTKLIFGVGAAENLNSELEALGVTKAVLLSSKSMFRQGVPQQLAELTGGKIAAVSPRSSPTRLWRMWITRQLSPGRMGRIV